MAWAPRRRKSSGSRCSPAAIHSPAEREHRALRAARVGLCPEPARDVLSLESTSQLLITACWVGGVRRPGLIRSLANLPNPVTNDPIDLEKLRKQGGLIRGAISER